MIDEQRYQKVMEKKTILERESARLQKIYKQGSSLAKLLCRLK